MRKEREALLIAALAGLVIVSAAAFAVQPSIGKSATAGQPGAVAALATVPNLPSRIG